MSTIRVIHLQFQDWANNSQKYYRVYLGPSWGLVQWGRLGGVGSMQNVSLEKAHNKLSEKRREGYQVTCETTFDSPADASSVSGRDALRRGADQAIGQVGAGAAVRRRSVEEQERDAAEEMRKNLLAMREKLRPETAKPAPKEPTGPPSIEDELAAALAKARGK